MAFKGITKTKESQSKVKSMLVCLFYAMGIAHKEWIIAEQIINIKKGKGLPQQAEVAQGDPGRLRPRIFLTFGTMRVVGRQPYAPAPFTPGEISGTHF
jgi:hypothetical protein